MTGRVQQPYSVAGPSSTLCWCCLWCCNMMLPSVLEFVEILGAPVYRRNKQIGGCQTKCGSEQSK